MSLCVVLTMTWTTNKLIIVIPWAVKAVTVGKAPLPPFPYSPLHRSRLDVYNALYSCLDEIVHWTVALAEIVHCTVSHMRFYSRVCQCFETENCPSNHRLSSALRWSPHDIVFYYTRFLPSNSKLSRPFFFNSSSLDSVTIPIISVCDLFTLLGSIPMIEYFQSQHQNPLKLMMQFLVL